MTAAAKDTGAAAIVPRPGRIRGLPAALAALVAVLAGLAFIVRVTALTPAGRAVAVWALDQAPAGGYGRIHVAGIDGDVLGAFNIRELTVDDGLGPWLTARDVRVRWSPAALLSRTVDVQDLTIARLTLARRPSHRQAAGGGASPVSIALDQVRARIEMTPAFADRYGLYDVTGRFALRRTGGMAGHITAASLTHAGDFLALDADLGRSKTVGLRLEAREGNGGAIAGALGLPTDQPFLVSATATGTTDRGRFTVASRSGAVEPLTSSGTWTPTGGSASGRITLDASKLLAPYEKALGPSVRFDLADGRQPGGLDELSLRAVSDNIDLSARGQADIGKMTTGPAGVRMTVAVKETRRLIGWPPAGPGGFAGTFAGRPDDWRIEGQGVLQGADFVGYRVAKVAGPVRLDWSQGRRELKTTADVSGGGGAGVLPALFGSRPQAAADLQWLDDGRLLIRSLAVDAPGLKVSAAGAHSLFGGLTFSGQATFANFALVHPGARGVMTARWSAAQSGASPWTFKIDGRSQHFSSGISVLDALTGAAPVLRADGLWKNGLRIGDAELEGAAGSARFEGLIGGDGALHLKADWRAPGAADLGPVRIVGPSSGTVVVSGAFDAPQIDIVGTIGSLLATQLELTAAHVVLSLTPDPAGVSGAMTLTASSAYGLARAKTSFQTTADGLALSGLAADVAGVAASGSAALRGEAPSSADLTVTIGPGVLLERGSASGRLLVTADRSGPRGSVTMTAQGALTRIGDLLVQRATLSAEGPLSDMPYKLEAAGFTPRGSWRADGTGTLKDAPSDFEANFEGSGRVRESDFRMLAPATLKIGPRESSVSAVAEIGGGRGTIEARVSAEAMAVKANLTGVDLSLVSPEYAGRFDAAISLEGEGARLSGSVDAKLAQAGERGSKTGETLNGFVRARLTGGAATVDTAFTGSEGLSSHAHLVLPVDAAAAPFKLEVARAKPMQGEFVADGEVGPLWSLAMGGEHSLNGRVHAQASLSGTIADPQAVGVAHLELGTFSDAATGLKLTHVDLDAKLDKGVVDVERFDAGDGAGGTLSGSGQYNLARGADSSFKLTLLKFRLLDNELATALASGQALVSRGADGAAGISGSLTIDKAELAANPPAPADVTLMDVVEIHREPGVGGRLAAGGGRSPPVTLDVSLTAPRGIGLKGRGLNADLALDAKVTGPLGAPTLSGTARIVRGVYDLGGKRFQVDTRSVVYLSSDPNKIRLDLTATREDTALTATVHIGGVAAKPEITLSSTPTLPTDEILAQVLFGTSASQLSPMGAAELASVVSQMQAGGDFDVTANLRAFAHLDRLAFGGDTAGAIVSGGKYLTSNVYVELAGGASGPAGAVEWRPQKNLSVISRVAGPGGDSQVSVQWHKDY